MYTLIADAGLGFVVGLVLALTGAGGGILAIPLLVFGLHLPLQQAAPIGLAAVGIAAAVGMLLGLREGIVRYRAALLIGAAGMLAAPLGVALAHQVPNRPLLVVFACVLAYTAWRMRHGGASRTAPGASASGRASDPQYQSDAADLVPAPPCVVDDAQGRLTWTRRCARALAATGAGAGLMSGLLGVGGGFVIVPSLTRFTDLDARSVQATSLAVIAMVSVSGVASAALHGAIDWGLALPFAGGAIVALLAGRRVARRLPMPRLQQAFAAIAAIVAVLMLARAAGWAGG